MTGAGASNTPSTPSANNLCSGMTGSRVSGVFLESAEERLDVSLDSAGRSCDGVVSPRVRSALDSSIDVPALLIDHCFEAWVSSCSECGR